MAFSSGENPDLAPRGFKPRTFLLGGNATATTYCIYLCFQSTALQSHPESLKIVLHFMNLV